jgi:hypothetical protein
MTSTLQIDTVSFDTTIEYFSFPLFHHIKDMGELARLRELPGLTGASFAGTNLDDDGLFHVAAVPTIENLNLQETRISNDGLAHLGRLPGLKYLRLKDNRQLTNLCIPHIVRLQALVDLQIHETSIDQDGLNQLVTLSNLRDICLYVCADNYSFNGLIELSTPWLCPGAR